MKAIKRCNRVHVWFYTILEIITVLQRGQEKTPKMARENIVPFNVNKLLKTFQWSICMKIFLGYWLANIYDTIWDKTVYGRLLSEQPSQKHMHFIQNVNISFSNHWALTQCNAFNNDLKIPPLNDNFNQAAYIVYFINQREFLSNDFYSNPYLIFVTTIQPAVVYFFQAGVLFSIENAKFWPILAHFDQFWLLRREFTYFLVYFLLA